MPLSKQCLAVSLRVQRLSQSRVAPDSRSGVCHTTIELAVARSGARGLSSTAVQGLTHQGKEPSSPSRFKARRSRRLFCPLVRANIGHRPIRELPRSQRFAQEKEQVLVARVVVKGLVEALDLGARTFEHLGKIGIAEKAPR